MNPLYSITYEKSAPLSASKVVGVYHALVGLIVIKKITIIHPTTYIVLASYFLEGLWVFLS